MRYLVVDDDIDVIEMMQTVLESESREVSTERSAEKALAYLADRPCDIVITDIRMPDMDGIELMKQIQARGMSPEIIVMSAYSSLPSAVAAINLGAERYIQKPFSIEHLETTVRQVEEKIRLKNENRKLLAELREANLTLKDNIEKMKALDNMKDEFFSMASHELRTPITIMKEYVLIIKDRIPGPLNEKQAEYLGIVEKSIGRLVRIVNNLLDLSKMESGKLEIEKKRTDMGSLVRTLVKNYEAAAAAKNIKLIPPAEQEGPFLTVDPERINQILMNLIDNALKFTEENGIIEVTLEKDGAWEMVNVIDSGIGISVDDYKKIFEKFGQVYRKAGPGSQGTGLGLPISQKLAVLHGGTVTVRSPVKPGAGGSCFTLRLPGEQ